MGNFIYNLRKSNFDANLGATHVFYDFLIKFYENSWYAHPVRVSLFLWELACMEDPFGLPTISERNIFFKQLYICRIKDFINSIFSGLFVPSCLLPNLNKFHEDNLTRPHTVVHVWIQWRRCIYVEQAIFENDSRQAMPTYRWIVHHCSLPLLVPRLCQLKRMLALHPIVGCCWPLV